jgi:hypothetical protein
MGAACSTYGWRGEVCTGFWCGILKDRYNLEEPGVDGRILLRWVFRKWCGVLDWIDLAENRDRWRELVNAVMSIKFGEFLEQLRTG